MATKKASPKKTVETLTHLEASRKNIPTAEHQSVVEKSQLAPKKLKYPRNPDLDPQLVWRGKDEQDWSDLVVTAPPIYIQEKVHPKALVDEVLRESQKRQHDDGLITPDLFADFNGIPHGVDKTEFYQHDQHWTNRMILGDSLQVMASLAEREGLRGKVQCIFFDPPYGIKFNSNFQWSTTSREVKDGKGDHITREPEQVKAFRDTWRDGIHSYLTYLRDRLTVARDLLTPSGSIFVQIGDENVHRVRAVMDEVFGDENCVAEIFFTKTTGLGTKGLPSRCDIVLWFSKDKEQYKYRQLFKEKVSGDIGASQYNWAFNEAGLKRKLGQKDQLRGNECAFHTGDASAMFTTPHLALPIKYEGKQVSPPRNRQWQTTAEGMVRLNKTNRLLLLGNSMRYVRLLNDFPVYPLDSLWTDTGVSGFGETKVYVVQTNTRVIERCILMSTDPGDLVLDPTCGSGTTASVAEQWGRRWITIDTSRVALALARARIMGARYPYYTLADSRDGQMREAEITRTAPSFQPTHGNIRHGFVYERVPHITLKSIANNVEIDVIWDKWQEVLEPLTTSLNAFLKKEWQEWEVPREADEKWSKDTKKIHDDWWSARISRQKEIDASIAAKGESEYLYDKPFEDKKKVRVAGPFTVESLSPHRFLGVDENDKLIDPLNKIDDTSDQIFTKVIIENLRTAGVQQPDKKDKIEFISLKGWAGTFICAEGVYLEGETQKRAAIFIGSEFGTVSRPDLVEAAREAADAGFDVLITCAFNYDAHASEFNKLGRIPVLKARMNADLHMAEDLKNTGKGNLFVIFGEPDIELINEKDGMIRVKVNGVDVFDPSTGEVRSDRSDGIACWFIDTDYNEESFFVRHAYFLGQNDPYSALKTTLKAEIDQEAWETLHSDLSRPFEKPKNGRIAIKVINHLGDEVMKVFKV